MSVVSKNRVLREIPSDKFSAVSGFIENIISDYGVNINIHDVAGLSAVSPELEKHLNKYMHHNNCFCRYVKQNSESFRLCVEQKQRLCERCAKAEGAFYGSCYMGAEEYVFPVKWNGALIAVVCVGLFFEDAAEKKRYISRRAESCGINKTLCTENYFAAATGREIDVKGLYYDISVLSEQLTGIYIDYISGGSASEKVSDYISGTLKRHKGEYIVTSAVSFIRENYDKDITLALIASDSCCNPSYLSHIFKEKTGVNISSYINEVRVEKAKQLLRATDSSVTDICFAVGFNDSNYFSRVFKQLTSLSPKDYRNTKNIQ